MGEAGLLRKLVKLAPAADGGLLVSSGDDAAVFRTEPGVDMVISQDALVEGFDWRPAWLGPKALGRRAMAVALSDLSAMGARPLYSVVTVCCPDSTLVEDLLALAKKRGGSEKPGGDER